LRVLLAATLSFLLIILLSACPPTADDGAADDDSALDDTPTPTPAFAPVEGTWTVNTRQDLGDTCNAGYINTPALAFLIGNEAQTWTFTWTTFPGFSDEVLRTCTRQDGTLVCEQATFQIDHTDDIPTPADAIMDLVESLSFTPLTATTANLSLTLDWTCAGNDCPQMPNFYPADAFPCQTMLDMEATAD